MTVKFRAFTLKIQRKLCHPKCTRKVTRNGPLSILCANQIIVFRNSFYRDAPHEAQLEVCLIRNQAYCRVVFRKENDNLLSKLHLKLPSPSIDRQVSRIFPASF